MDKTGKSLQESYSGIPGEVISGLFLKPKIEDIALLVGNRVSFLDFDNVSERKELIILIRAYINHVNLLTSDDFGLYSSDIITGWKLVKGLLPLLFNVPPSLLLYRFDYNRLMYSCLGSICIYMNRTVNDETNGTREYYMGIKEKNLNPILRFIGRHHDFGVGIEHDKLDEQDGRIIDAYTSAITTLIKYADDAPKHIRRMLHVITRGRSTKDYHNRIQNQNQNK